MTRIKTNGTINLRTTPELKPPVLPNILTTIPAGRIVEADEAGDFFALTLYVHKSVVTVLPDAPVENSGIPYRSQWSADASNRSADCGQTCVAMCAESRGVQVAVNDLRYQSASNGLSNGSDLVKNFAAVGIEAQWSYMPAGEIMPLSGAICLVSYAGFDRANVQDVNYYGLHWVVFLREDPISDSVFVHDPDFWGSRQAEGAAKRYSRREWQKAFIPSGAGRVIVTML